MLDEAKHSLSPMLRSSRARLSLPPVWVGLTSSSPSLCIFRPPLIAPCGRDSICEVPQTRADLRPCRITVPHVRDWGTGGRNQTPEQFCGVGFRATAGTPHNAKMRLQRHLRSVAPRPTPENQKSSLTAFPESRRAILFVHLFKIAQPCKFLLQLFHGLAPRWLPTTIPFILGHLGLAVRRLWPGWE